MRYCCCMYLHQRQLIDLKLHIVLCSSRSNCVNTLDFKLSQLHVKTGSVFSSDIIRCGCCGIGRHQQTASVCSEMDSRFCPAVRVHLGTLCNGNVKGFHLCSWSNNKLRFPIAYLKAVDVVLHAFDNGAILAHNASMDQPVKEAHVDYSGWHNVISNFFWVSRHWDPPLAISMLHSVSSKIALLAGARLGWSQTLQLLDL